MKIQDGSYFEKLHMSLPIHRCIDISNTLRIDGDAIFLKIFVIPGGMRPPQIPAVETSATLPKRSGRY